MSKIFSDVYKMYNAKNLLGEIEMCFLVCFFVPSLLDAQPALQLRSFLSFQALCTLPPRVPNPPMTLPRVPEVKATGVQPKGSSTFCSVTRLQWFTLITRSYTNRKQTGSDCPLRLFPTDMCKKVMKMNKTPKVVELDSESSQTQKKTCPLSIATVPRPSRGGQYWDLTASSPIHQGPTTRSHLHPNPWPGRLTSQSCNVRSVLEKPLENGRKKHRVIFFSLYRCLNTLTCHKKITGPATVVPWLESSDFCPASSAKLSARHSGEATQRNSKLCSARPSRCRNACKDLSSVKLTSGHPQLSLEGPIWHIQTSIQLHFIYIIHPDPSSSSSPSLSDSLIRPPSSFIRHPSSFNHASIFHHSSCLHPNQERQEASKCKAWTPRGRWDIKSSKCWPLKCCNPAKDSCTSLPEDSFLASQSSHGITLRSKIYRYTVRCLSSPGQKCKNNNMNNVVFAVAKRELLHVALYRKNVLLRGLFFFVLAVTSPFMR